MSTPKNPLVDESAGPIRTTYGSTDIVSPGGPDHEALIGEELITTDNEEEYTIGSSRNPSDSSIGTTLWSCCSAFGDSVLNLQGNHPVGHVTRVLLVIGVAISMCTLAMVLSPHRSGIAAQGNIGEPDTPIIIPFARVDRATYGQPASAIVDPDLFHPDLLHNSTIQRRSKTVSGEGDTPVHPFLVEPFPTGAFWTNLVLKPTADHDLSYPVVAYPYAYKWSDTLLQASYPALRRRIDNISIRDSFVPDITFSSEEEVAKRYVTKFDPLSVTTRFQTDSGGYWESYLVQGSPYITIKYEKATPLIRALSIFKDVFCPFDSDGNYNDGMDLDTKQSDVDGGSESNEDFRGLKWGVCSSSVASKTDDNTFKGKTLRGVQFLLQTQEGLTWMVFASEPINLSFDSIRRTSVASTEKFSGVLRLALIPPSPGSETSGSAPISESTGVRRLIYHAGVYPVGGSVSWEFRTASTSSSFSLKSNAAITENYASITGIPGGADSSPPNRIATIHFNFNTKQMNANSKSTSNSAQEELLMLSLPHHAESLRSDVLLQLNEFDLAYLSIKGRMTPVLGDTWSYVEPLPSIGFDDDDVMSNEKYAEEVDPEVRRIIMENVRKDLTRVLPTFDENVYGFGKQVARLAQLVHISNLMAPIAKAGLRQNHTDTMRETTANAAQSLHSFLAGFLGGGVTDQLLYDGNFGGIVTKAGLLNSEADFGNGWYNDHHFHYGYILYACAIMGKMNETFVSEYGHFVDALLFDVADSTRVGSEGSDSVFFPLARHKSWFDGHSFASGLFPFGNGKSQESSSEAVNCYYGAYLWSLVRFGTESDAALERTDFARLLLATEIRGAKYYWHMLPPNENATKGHRQIPQVYDTKFAKNYMVGNLGMLDAVCSTWFGTQSLYVHMINFMPVTAVTAQLFNKSYVQEEFKEVIGPLLPNVEMAWRGFAICDQAIVDPMGAWTAAQDLVSYEMDASLSKSQVLHWISTRGGIKFAPASPASSPTAPDENQEHGEGTDDKTKASSSCESHEGCASLGLTGACCPTADGINLGCCNQ